MNDSDKKPLLRTSEEGHRLAQLNILGNFALSHADGRQLTVPTKKNRALLAILALSPGFQATRERLCGLLWGDRGEDQARSSLRQSLAVLRKELGEAEPFLLQTRDDVVELRPGAIRVDAVEFLKLARANDLGSLRPAATLYRGELLADTSMKGEDFDEWLSIERRRLSETIIGVLDRLCAMEIGPDKVETARRLVDLDPLREASHRALMRAHAEAGEAALALQQFEACRAILKAEFGVEPAAETQALRTAIAKGTFSKAEAAAGASKGEGFDRNPPVPADKPSIAVLPFANLTGDPHQDFLCDGISQNITDDLARFHDLVVIASDSAFVYRNRNASIQAMSQDLGARYLLQGSVVTSGNHLRIQARLVDGKSGQHVWSESYDGHPDSIFSLQDSVTKTIASTLATAYGGRLLKAWERRPDRAATRNMQAIDLFQRGMQSLNRFTKEDNETARRLFQEAAQHDPNYAKPLAKAAWTHIIDC
ncbi:MAG TPA: BTAD domain-containing putative transcriptional regulator, partial [Pyrinomonadaceae bacterium]|nr:BTAD domain-containing putative transcriptional regulator [Pyrinomonadaceae bacterium]